MELNSNETPQTSGVINMALESNGAPKSNGSVVRPKFKPRPGFYERRAADLKRNAQFRKHSIQAEFELYSTMTSEELKRFREENEKEMKEFFDYAQLHSVGTSEEDLLNFLENAPLKTSEFYERVGAIVDERIKKEEENSFSEEGNKNVDANE